MTRPVKRSRWRRLGPAAAIDGGPGGDERSRRAGDSSQLSASGDSPIQTKEKQHSSMPPQTKKKVAAALADAILTKMHQMNLVAAVDSWRTGAVHVQDEEQESTMAKCRNRGEEKITLTQKIISVYHVMNSTCIRRPEYIHIYEGKIYKEPLKKYNNKKTNINLTLLTFRPLTHFASTWQVALQWSNDATGNCH
jgi:hypothetical protein